MIDDDDDGGDDDDDDNDDDDDDDRDGDRGGDTAISSYKETSYFTRVSWRKTAPALGISFRRPLPTGSQDHVISAYGPKWQFV